MFEKLQIVFKILLISTPEQIFIFLFALQLSNFKQIGKRTFPKIITAIIAPAIISNLLNLMHISLPVSIFAGIFVNSLFLNIINRKPILKNLFYASFSFLTFMAIEFAVLSAIFNFTPISIDEVSNNVLLASLISIPERIPQYTLILCNYYIKNYKNKSFQSIRATFERIISSKSERRPLAIALFINILYFTAIPYVFIYFDLLANATVLVSIIVLVSAMVLPCLSAFYIIQFIINSCGNGKNHCKFVVSELECNVLSALEEPQYNIPTELTQKIRTIFKSADM